jgi:hypothetical protein
VAVFPGGHFLQRQLSLDKIGFEFNRFLEKLRGLVELELSPFSSMSLIKMREYFSNRPL